MSTPQDFRSLITLLESVVGEAADIYAQNVARFPVDPDTFKTGARSHGYTRIEDHLNRDKDVLMAVWTPNGVKCEIKLNRGGWDYLIGYGLATQKNPEDPTDKEYGKELLSTLADTVTDAGFSVIRNEKSMWVKGDPSAGEAAILSRFWELTNIVANISAINAQVQQSRRGAGGMIAPSDLKFYKSVYNDFVNAISGGRPDIVSRGGKGYDARDHLITVGITPEGREALENGGDIQREHAVPGDLISKKIIEMIKAGRVAAGKLQGPERKEFERNLRKQIINLLKWNLLIVITSKKQSEHLDSKAGMNMKTTMPDDWSFNQNKPLKRLRDAGFKIEDLTDNDRKLLNQRGIFSKADVDKNKKLRDKPVAYRDKNKPERIDIDNLEENN